MRKKSTGAAVLAILVACLAIATAATADTVYLKNGRVIHSSLVIVEAERVVVRQYDGMVAFPIEIVDRIEQNDRVEPGGFVPPQPELPEGLPAADLEAADPEAADPEAAVDPETGQALPPDQAPPPDQAQQADPATQPEEDPRRTREYWQNRLQPLFQQIDRAEREADSYRDKARTSAEAQRQLDRIEAHISDLNRQIDAIRTEARRYNIPAGWLRR